MFCPEKATMSYVHELAHLFREDSSSAHILNDGALEDSSSAHVLPA